MSAPIPAYPRTPGEVSADATLDGLVAQYHAHAFAVVVERPHMVELAAADAVFAHGVAALALLHALVDRLQAARWATVSDALAANAGRGAEVAAACALDGAEVAAGLRSWADGQRREGLMTAAERGVVDLLARGVDGER